MGARPTSPSTSAVSTTAAPAATGPTGTVAGIDERYVERDPRAIAKMLGRLVDDYAPITCSYGTNSEVLRTHLTSVSRDGGTVYLPCEPDEQVNLALDAAGWLTCITRLDGVPLEFRLCLDRRVTRAGVFASPTPRMVMRLQRRDFYRLFTPADLGVRCTFAVPRPDGEPRPVTTVVADISGGGLAVLLPPAGPSVRPGASLGRCTVVLPGIGTFETGLEVRNVARFVDAAGNRQHRVGCAFVDLPDSRFAMVQRFIRQEVVVKRAR